MIVVLTLVLLWLLLPGTRLFPPPVTALQRDISDGALDVSRQLNEDLESRARALEAALEGAVCTPEGDLLLPDGRTPDGLLPPAQSVPADPQTQDDANLPGQDQSPEIQDGIANPLVPPDPARVQPSQPPGQDGSVANLLDLVDPRTVLVIVPTADGFGTGTGFFIAPDIVATNHHVIETALGGGEIFVTNDALESVRPAVILASMGPFEQTGGDFALLRIEGASEPHYSLVGGDVDVKGQAVIAAGYPGDIVYDDMRFQRLLDGTGTEAPDLVVTDGMINSQQELADSISMLIHSASISQGNSGGPLVDLCGRVVGVNTFISEESFRNLNLAQSMLNLQQFLQTTGVPLTYSAEECSPVVRNAPPAPETAPETGPTDAEAPN